MTDFTGLYDIRDFKPEDANFVLGAFKNGVYYGDSRFSQMLKKVFMENYKKLDIPLTTDGSKYTIKVACLKEDQDTILGYSILSADYSTIHWVYVKEKWRKHGIGKSLVPRHPTYVTHLTQIGQSLLSKFNHIIFDPFKL